MTESSAERYDPHAIPIGWATVLLPPLLAIGLLTFILFAPILGVQATEIAKLVHEAEIDLTALLQGNPPTGAFNQLVPKIALFNILLIGWILVVHFTTIGLSRTLAPLRLRLALAIVISLALPAVLLFKYWTANRPIDHWAYSLPLGEKLDWLVVVLEKLPGLSSGGMWIFSFIILIQLVVFQWLLARFHMRRRIVSDGTVCVPVLFFASILIFVSGALMTMYGPHQFANRLGTINIVILYVLLLYSSLAGLLYYLHTRWGMRVILAVALYLVAINLYAGFITPDTSRTPRIVTRSPSTLPASSEDAFPDWFRSRSRTTSSKPFPVFVIAASGGGMRATLRTAFFLEHMRVSCPAFLRHTFAISSVSGGALGALLAVAQSQIPTETVQDRCTPIEPTLQGTGNRLFKSAPLLEEFVGEDIIPAIVGAGLFAEAFQRVLPPGVLPRFDRSMALRNDMAANWAQVVDKIGREVAPSQSARIVCKLRDYLSSCDSNSYWDKTGNTPLLVFNATSATDGGVVPLSNVHPAYFSGVPLSRLSQPGYGPSQPTTFELLSGAITSARFPIALPATPYRDVNGNSHYVVDGGYFDNSGLLIARAIKRRIGEIITINNADAEKPPINAQVFILYLHETEYNKSDCEAAKRLSGEPVVPEAAPLNAEFAHVNALFGARDKLSAMSYTLMRELDRDAIIDIAWDIHVPPPANVSTPDPSSASDRPTACGMLLEFAPLAFYYAPATRKNFILFLEEHLLDQNKSKLLRVQTLLQP